MRLHSKLWYCLARTGFCICCLAKMVYLSAQTSTPASGTPSQLAADPSATQFPGNSKSPPSALLPADSDIPALWNGYETHYAVEFGGRSLANTGNTDVYSTFVNLKSGLRLMNQSLEMHSNDHTGLLFDDLSLSSSGLGGDPNEAIRLRAGKHRWYDFSGSWRRDINFWDYNLLGNPLNPPTSKPFTPVNVSPALLDLSRKMLDLNLTLRPNSNLQFTLGYSHYNNGGPSLTSIHQGTEAELYQQWHDVSDSYNFGVSWRPRERIRISYDQFYTHNKSDTNDYLNSFPYSLSNSTPVNLGISFGNGSPCATPFVGTAVNPTCSLFAGYSNVAPYYTDIPTEQLGFQTNYFRRLHVNGRASYTGAQTHLPNSKETYNGFSSGFGAGQLQSVTTGSASIQQITTSVDTGVTYEITERFSIDDQFRWYDYRIPSGAAFVQSYLFGATALSMPNTFSSATCPPPFTGAGCPQHTSNAAADQTATSYAMFQAQNKKRNTVELRYDFASNLTGYIGYRFERVGYVVDGTSTALLTYFPTLANRGGCMPVAANGVCQAVAASAVSSAGVEINNQSGLIGLAAQPIHGLRLNADAEFSYADNVFTNIMPRHRQLYRGKANFTRNKWFSLNAGARVEEMRNLAYGLGNLQHNRSFSVGAVFPFSPRVGFDVSYTYDNFLTNLNICFSQTPAPAYATVSSFCSAGYLTALSYYRNIDHFGSANLFLKPLARTTLTAGYTITSTNGSNLLLNPLAPLGPLAINYHLPSAAVAIDVAKHLTFKAGWNLFDYGEKSLPGPVAPRNFRANLISISLRYAL